MLKDRLKTLRLNKNLTQKDIANRLGTNYQTYQQWERGVRTPKIDSLNKLAEIFEVSTDYLTGRTESFDEILNILRDNNPSEDDKVKIYNLIEDYFKNK
ncbi:helix-turn-helix domain-containing protein [Lactococcus petauri]|uniref:helix-turn-helix domain-containing protein n=1 Tax=Lactococcus petauri TaxID=1940789 RepID=UPI00177C8B4A|nr:helix-turn-helix transcriptional regulator [Lactococcus petauri]